MAAMRAALDAFIDTIEATRRLHPRRGRTVAPEGDPDWIDLGEAYVRACTAIGRTPLIVGTGTRRRSKPSDVLPRAEGAFRHSNHQLS